MGDANDVFRTRKRHGDVYVIALQLQVAASQCHHILDKKSMKATQRGLLRRRLSDSNADTEQVAERYTWKDDFDVVHYFLGLWVRYLIRVRLALIKRVRVVICDR